MALNKNLQKIHRALISVSDKRDLIRLAQFLIENNVEIISTGGSAKMLREHNIKTIDIADFTGFAEIMDGRVKTLHPKIHGALLGVLGNEQHQKQAAENQILSIDLLIVNLYPFIDAVKNNKNANEIVENIDIGGPAMIRSAAKNSLYKTVISDIADYDLLINEMKINDGATSLSFRQNQARKAFTITANYDQAIASYFSDQQKINFAQKLLLPASLQQNLRYGENPHQKAALYANDFADYGIVCAKQLQGKELSYNNFNDADAAFNIVAEFDSPAAVVVKHTNPCGAAIADDIAQAYSKAWAADSKSAFGGIVALNRAVKKDLAQLLSQIFYEVIIAPAFDLNALEILAKKKNLRLLEAQFKNNQLKYWQEIQIKSISGGFLLQELDDKIIRDSDLQLASRTSASDEQIQQLLFAMQLCKNVKSNAIVIANNFQTIAIAVGQTSRVDAVQIACEKAGLSSKGAVLASDAFFPFADNIEIAANYGIAAIIAPSGSVKDKEVIDKANEKNIALLFTNSRHFKH